MRVSVERQDDFSQMTKMTEAQDAQVEKIEKLLASKDDTSRFVGLALLRGLLDQDASVREEPEAVARLWAAVPPIFLDRLMKQTGPDTAMRDLAAAVIYTFTALLPERRRREDRLLQRLPRMVSSLGRR